MPRVDATVDTDLVEAVCRLHDDVYRNQWITYVYDDVSRRVNGLTGGGANWFTFARWSSFTVGENLRLDKPSAAFDEMVDAHWLFRMARSRMRELQRDLRLQGDGAMPRILAVGNTWVFDEIAEKAIEFLEWCERHPDADEAEWKRYRARIAPTKKRDLFPRCDPEWLREGLESYWRASRAPTAAEKARLVFKGNVMLAAYEQWRLQPIVDVALDPLARHLVEFENMDLHANDGGEPRVVLRRRRTPWAFRHRSPLVEWFCDIYASYLTTRVMAWQGPVPGLDGKSLFLGKALPADIAYPPALADIDQHPELLIARVFDRSGGQADGRRSRSWVRYSDRMNFIVNLFRALQEESALFTEISDREKEILGVHLSERHLTKLRTYGDDPVDGRLAAHLAGCQVPQPWNPRMIVEHALEHGRERYLDDGGVPPEWASVEQLRLGQEFLRRHGLEIGTALFFAALPYSYSASRGAHVLMRTAELTTGNTSRRLAETGKLLHALMVVDKARTPLQPGTVASNAIRGVRLFHAAVRQTLLNDDEDRWNEKKFGHPVNQEDLLGTLIVFTVVVLDAIEELGIRFDDAQSKKERDAYVHLWLVVGHLLGIDYEKLRPVPMQRDRPPLTLEELRFLQIAIFRRNAGPSLDGQTLMASLLEATGREMWWPFRGYPASATRALIGRDVSDALAVPPDGPGRALFEAARLVTHALALPGPSWRIGDRVLTLPGPRDAVGGFAKFASFSLYDRWIRKNAPKPPPWDVPAVDYDVDLNREHALEKLSTEFVRNVRNLFK